MAIRKISILMEQGSKLIDYYRQNPCIAAYDLCSVDLAPIQRVIFEDMWFKSYVIAVVSRGGGKTFLQGLLAVLSSMLYPGYRTGLIGPSFRQSKYMFSEVEKLYAKSPIVREACEKKPISATDRSYLRFKTVAGRPGSYIEALPLGVDGAKIRGSRFYLICVDELAQIPDKVLDLVVRPFAAVVLEPMENVRKIEKQRKLIEQGLVSEDDFEGETVNKMIMTSSGFFKFNHMWRRMKDHWVMMDRYGDESKHVVHQVPYKLLPEGFLVEDSIREAKRTMSSYEFKMEYEAAMISDSEGLFKVFL